MSTPVYVAIAYQGGFTNGYSYVVTGGTDLAAVEATIEREDDSANGEYGIEIVEHVGGQERRVKYIPSVHQEAEPIWSPGIEIARRLGASVYGAIEDERKRHHPIPDWLMARYHDAEEIAMEMSKLEKQT